MVDEYELFVRIKSKKKKQIDILIQSFQLFIYH